MEAQRAYFRQLLMIEMLLNFQRDSLLTASVMFLIDTLTVCLSQRLRLVCCYSHQLSKAPASHHQRQQQPAPQRFIPDKSAFTAQLLQKVIKLLCCPRGSLEHCRYSSGSGVCEVCKSFQRPSAFESREIH